MTGGQIGSQDVGAASRCVFVPGQKVAGEADSEGAGFHVGDMAVGGETADHRCAVVVSNEVE
ncbi:hypothetical protein [Pseudonocardia sp. ICBG601]|uniref:hypothetical protein n=1 Tax=Pseudonocardia sp. ICBG601 TaxID=2846759 RepID=UPI001CF60C89|nr:hypothetical protein [Pseudonocardia sp. ICBG601]